MTARRVGQGTAGAAVRAADAAVDAADVAVDQASVAFEAFEEAPPAELLADLGIAVRDAALLSVALTHRSFVNERSGDGVADNERLEFLGDAVIGYLVGERVFRALPHADEGVLTRVRASLVCQASLASFARQVRLGRYLRLGRGEASGGGRDRPALLCGGFEAVVGALYLDGGMDACARMLDRFVAPELERLTASLRAKDARSLFQERVQALWKVTPRYDVASQIGPDHAKRFVVEVRVGERVWARGEGRSKAEAAQAAAVEAIDALDALEAHSSRESAPPDAFGLGAER